MTLDIASFFTAVVIGYDYPQNKGEWSYYDKYGNSAKITATALYPILSSVIATPAFISCPHEKRD